MKNSKIKQEIKRLSEEQIILKPQRKTVYFTGTRTVGSYKATEQALENKERLRHLFVAYDVLRNKEVIPFTKKEFSQALVDKYVEEYKEITAPETEA